MLHDCGYSAAALSTWRPLLIRGLTNEQRKTRIEAKWESKIQAICLCQFGLFRQNAISWVTQKTTNLSKFWRLRSPRSRCQQIPWCSGPVCLQIVIISTYPQTMEGEESFSVLVRATIWPHDLITLQSLDLSLPLDWEWWFHTWNVQSTAASNRAAVSVIVLRYTRRATFSDPGWAAQLQGLRVSFQASLSDWDQLATLTSSFPMICGTPHSWILIPDPLYAHDSLKGRVSPPFMMQSPLQESSWNLGLSSASHVVLWRQTLSQDGSGSGLGAVLTDAVTGGHLPLSGVNTTPLAKASASQWTAQTTPGPKRQILRINPHSPGCPALT